MHREFRSRSGGPRIHYESIAAAGPWSLFGGILGLSGPRGVGLLKSTPAGRVGGLTPGRLTERSKR
jgi:hypothetical protein